MSASEVSIVPLTQLFVYNTSFERTCWWQSRRNMTHSPVYLVSVDTVVVIA